MKHSKVISHKHLPSRLPIMTTIVIWLLLDRLHPPGWYWGVVITLVAILWIGGIVSITHETETKLSELG